MICKSLSSCMELDHSNGNPCAVDKSCIISADRRANVTCSENRKSYTFSNSMRHEVINYRVDGGMIEEDSSVGDGVKKCDFLYIVKADRRIPILIELKGRNIERALKQLNQTAELLAPALQKADAIYARVVVQSSVPNLRTTPAYVSLRRKLKLGNIKVHEKRLTESLDDLAK